MNVRRECWAFLLVAPLAGCAGSVQDAADEYLSSVESATDGSPHMRVLEAAERELPDGVRVPGLADDDGDGFDDDGFVAMNLDGEWRCITLPDDDAAGRVSEGACA